MKKAILFLFLFVFAASTYSEAQISRYIVRLKNKGGTTATIANPAPYLSVRAIARRTKYAIGIDSTDLPISATYLSQIRAVPNVTVHNVSKWLNAISIQTNDPNAITTINGFWFVQSVTGVASRTSGRDKFDTEIFTPTTSAGRLEQLTADYYNYGTTSFNEIKIHNGQFLHNIGLRGQNMHIAILDGGFFNYTTLRSFDSINTNGQVLSTWDFVDRNASVVEDNSHGMQCLSTIAANIPGQFIGKAPKASFHLFRTEDVSSEYPIEEFNWVCGAERADSSGADLISSSLGYGYDFGSGIPDYPKSSLDGNTNMSSIAADLAAKKGLLVFNSAGNEGNGAWQTILSPADADSIVAVGAINTDSLVASFSSYGPSADGQVKPDVASVGAPAMVQGGGGNIGFNNGTSFSCPNMAGLSACLWQAFPEVNNMRIIRALRQASHKANNPDNRMGYGIPNMKLAFSTLLIEYATSSASLSGCDATITWNSKDVAAMKYEIERKLPNENNYSKVGELNPQAGDILANHTYNFSNTIVSNNAGVVSYRIRQVIDTAAASFTAVYIDTASVTTTSPCVNNAAVSLIRVQPNPTAGNTTLVVETNNAIPDMPVAVFDSKGSLVLQVQSSKTAGIKTIDLPTQKLQSGIYYVRVFRGNKVLATIELVKL